jgi:hypothetical protein
MPRRKGFGTPPPTEPAKPGSPPDDDPIWKNNPFWKGVREEVERRRRDGVEPQYAGVPPWARQEIQATRARIKSSPGCLTEKEEERFNTLLQWQRQEEEDWRYRREAAIEARDLLEQEREQERRAQERQERERQAEQIEKLERSRLDLEERLGFIGALVDKAIDGVDVQANLIAAKALTARQRAAGERSGEVRANKAWHAAARKIISDNPELGHAALVRKIRQEAEPPVKQRAVEQFVTDELSRK